MKSHRATASPGSQCRRAADVLHVAPAQCRRVLLGGHRRGMGDARGVWTVDAVEHGVLVGPTVRYGGITRYSLVGSGCRTSRP